MKGQTYNIKKNDHLHRLFYFVIGTVNFVIFMKKFIYIIYLIEEGIKKHKY